MKNKKGFTLIELLAVIVVLAIIALIATPIVMNTIKKSQKGVAERSADNYIDAVETAVATVKLDGNDVPDGNYTIDGEGNLTGAGLPNGKLEIDMKGNKPTGGTITIKNGQVTTDSKMSIGDYDVKYNPTNNKYEAAEKSNDTNTVLCRANTSKTTALVWNGNEDPFENSSYIEQEVGLLSNETTSKYDMGVTYTCELGDGEEENTFFVLETNGNTVSLILNKNIGGAIDMSSDEFKIEFQKRTSGWTKLNQNQITLPTASQVAKTVGLTFDGTNELFSIYGGDLPTWIKCYGESFDGFGYYVSDVTASGNHWRIFYDGLVAAGGTHGIRPVITISKSQLG